MISKIKWMMYKSKSNKLNKKKGIMKNNFDNLLN